MASGGWGGGGGGGWVEFRSNPLLSQQFDVRYFNQ